VGLFAEEREASRQRLQPLDDEQYRHEKFGRLARFFGDPQKPLIPANWTINPFFKLVYIFGLICAAAAILSALGLHDWFAAHIAPDSPEALFRRLTAAPGALWLAAGIYALGSVCFFPITAMTAAAVLAFGPLKGIIIAYTGSLVGGIVSLEIGRLIGQDRLESLFGEKVGAILERIRNAGIPGIALIRLVPLAPYGIVNMVFGAANVPRVLFIAGTAIGLAPGKLAIALTGHGFFAVIENPAPGNFLSLGLGFFLWIGVIAISHYAATHWRGKGRHGRT
jgi:uncharacterized membrane protein YdjX (TVP38/TMEM64 family)